MSFLSSALRFTAGVGVSFLTVLGFAEGQTRTRLAVPNPSPVGRVVLEGSVDVLGYVGGHEQRQPAS